MVASIGYRRPSPMELYCIPLAVISNGLGRTPPALRKSLFKFTVKRSEFCNQFEDTYDCIYKFDVHAGDDPGVLTQEESTPCSDITSESLSFYRDVAAADSGGILLIVVVQWEVPHPSTDKVQILHLGTYDRAFFVNPKTRCSLDLDSSLGDIISPILLDLGILSPDRNRLITSLLVSCAISVVYYGKSNKDDKGHSVVLKIAIERNRAEPENYYPWCYADYVLWGLRDGKRLLLGLELQKKEKISELEEEGDCCAICLKEFQPDMEVVRIQSCSHFYHSNCIMEWFNNQQHDSCPSCRTPVPLDSKWRRNSKMLYLA